MLILASASPRRRELLARAGVAVQVAPADIDECAAAGEDAVSYARRIAAAKADAVAARHPGRWVLAADTVVEVDGDLLGKPADTGEARAMLARLAGRSHRVTTAYRLRGPDGAAHDGHVTTEVVMRPLSPREIDEYVASGEWRGKAGGYAVQGIAAAIVREVRGSITNVVGLPLAEVVELLSRAGGPRADLSQGVAA
ncbi:MAG: septum formation protein Maf [Deltaproteobacteria bacterium]|nr:MAG: septum formation protein Maf [Deltaproteobacteria bacterium]